MREFNYLQFLRESQEMMLVSARLYSWQMDREFHLHYTNHSDGQFLYDLFKISTCNTKIIDHFSSQSTPVIVADNFGFTWIVAAMKEADVVSEYHLLGPFFTVEASEHHLMRLCSQLRISSGLADQMRAQLKQLPTIPVMSVLSYAVMLQYYSVGVAISPNEVVFTNTAIAEEAPSVWETTEHHNSWEAECNLFEAIKNGTLDLEGMTWTNSFSGITVGTLCPGDPLRQTKDEAIVLIILSTRAAILGGVSPEGGYSIADYYFQRVEACQSVGNVQNCCFEILRTVLQRVQMCKQRQYHSDMVSGCMDYVETHLFEKINLEQMAKELGYASYYLSKRFKEETGTSVNDYIKEEKINKAKLLFTRGDLTVNEVSERLSFSSPSYFSTVFKQYTGMLPSEFQSLSQSRKNQT